MKDENNKLKLNKMNKQIETKRKNDIKEVRMSGDYVLTTGKDQDTVLEIYSFSKLNLVESLNIGEIQNVHMKVTPDDKFIVISTYMYELAVVELLRNKKFNHTSLIDEEFLKTQRLKSIGGIKVHISDYDFSNDNRFFIVSSEDGSVKVFHNHGNISSSTILTDFSVKKEINNAEKVTLYVDEFDKGHLKGLIALSNEGDIYVCDADGKQRGMFKKAHDTTIMTLKIAKEGNNFLLVSGSRDGKFHVHKLN